MKTRLRGAACAAFLVATSGGVQAANDVQIIDGSDLTNISGSPQFVTIDDSAVLGMDHITDIWSGSMSASVSVSTGTGGINSQPGDLDFLGTLDYNGSNYSSKTLSLSAHNNINISGTIYDSIDPPLNSLSLNLTPDSDAIGGGVVNLSGTLDGVSANVSGNLNISTTGVLHGALLAESVSNTGQITSSNTNISNNLTLDAGGAYTADGVFKAGSVTNNGGSFSFSGHWFELTSSGLAVDSSGLLGENVTLNTTTGLDLLAVQDLSVGSASTDSGTFTVESGVGAAVEGTLTINAGGTVNFTGGNLTAGAIDNSAGGQFNFSSGALHLSNSGLTVGSGELLGDDVTLTNSRVLGVEGDLTVNSGSSLEIAGGYNVFGGSAGPGLIDNYGTTSVAGGFLGTNDAFINQSGATLNLSGGELAVGSLTNNGSFNFTGGMLDILDGDVDVGLLSNGGATATIGSEQKLFLRTGDVVIGAGESLSLDGGTISSDIINSGTFNFNSGTLFTGQVSISDGGLFGNSLSLSTDRILFASSIDITSGSSLAVNSGLHATDSGITAAGNVTIASGAELDTGNEANYSQNGGATVVNGSLNAGTVSITGGTMRGAGIIDATSIIVDGGVLTPGNSTGVLNLNGTLVLTENGTLHFEIGSDSSGGYLWDQLMFSDPFLASVSDFQGGEIEFSLLDGFAIEELESSFTIGDFFRFNDPNSDPTMDYSLFALLPLTELAEVGFSARDESFLYTLALSDIDGTFSVTSVSAVPLPAAAWLFGSGLLGLVGVSRKRRA